MKERGGKNRGVKEEKTWGGGCKIINYKSAFKARRCNKESKNRCRKTTTGKNKEKEK